MTRAEKRAAILTEFARDPSRSDREIARAVGADHKTVGALRAAVEDSPIPQCPHDGEIEIPQSPQSRPNGEIPHVRETEIHHAGEIPNGVTATCPLCVDLDFLRDPAKASPARVADWLIARWPKGIERIITALRHRQSASENEITIAWEAAKAARDLARRWSTARLDELCAEIAKGKPTRMTAVEKLSLWGSDKAPMSISIPDDPARAAAKLWLYWGATPSKMQRLSFEIRKRSGDPPSPPPSPPEEPDIPF